MKIIAFDQASINTGFSVYEDGNLIESGLIQKSKSIPIDDRIPQMAIAICKKIKETDASLVIIEDIQQQRSPQTTIDLARLQGCIIMYCTSKHITLKILAPSVWRKCLSFEQGPKIKKEQLKQQAIDYVKRHFGIDVKVNDESDAICLGFAACGLYDTK